MGEIFSRAHYRVGYTGKWHLNGRENGQPGGGFPADIWYDLKNHRDRVGAERHQAFIRAVNGGVVPWAQGGVSKADGDRLRAHDGEKALKDLHCREEEMHAHICVDKASEFLQKNSEDPFCLVVSLDEPHGPFLTPPEWQSRFNIKDYPKPNNFKGDLSNKPLRQQQQQASFPLGEWEDFAEWRLAHLRCTAWMDSQIGRLMQALDDSGKADDTIVVFTSDHGDMGGQHGLWSKAMMYESCAGIPPHASSGCQPGVSTDAVSHLDVLPTLA